VQYLGFALLVVGPIIGSTALAQTSAFPIALDRSTVLPPIQDSNHLGIVAVTFTNHAAIPAKRVVLDVVTTDDAMVARINDYGTFSPGVAISHRYYLLGVGKTPQRVVIDSATMADGSVIENRPHAMPRRQQAMGYEVQMAGPQ
jgi:hypothetical protein